LQRAWLLIGFAGSDVIERVSREFLPDRKDKRKTQTGPMTACGRFFLCGIVRSLTRHPVVIEACHQLKKGGRERVQ